MFSRINNLGYSIKLTEKGKDFVAEKGFDPQFGARPLNRALQKYLEDLVAEEILKGDLHEGDMILADHDGKSDTLQIKVKKKPKQKEQKKDEWSSDRDKKRPYVRSFFISKHFKGLSENVGEVGFTTEGNRVWQHRGDTELISLPPRQMGTKSA